MAQTLKVLVAVSEAVPFIKTGGLADVSGTLVRELRKLNIDARLIMPLYKKVAEEFSPKYTGIDIALDMGQKILHSQVYSIGTEAYFLRCDELYNADDIYGTSESDYSDNAKRFIYFSRAVPLLCQNMGFMPDVIHLNDWQTALIALYLKTIYREQFKRHTATVLSIHNLGYQGVFPESAMTLTGLGHGFFNPGMLEFYGRINLLKAGIICADMVSTVSETYAKEIATEQYGFALDGVLRARASDIKGIPNGIDTDVWNPETDQHIPARFSAGDVSGKRLCRNHLIRECNFRHKELPIISIIGRLSTQKGLDIFVDAADSVFPQGMNMIILGTGDIELQRKLMAVASSHPEHVSLNIGFDETLSHVIYAGSDMILIPSEYEPCGLTQMISMRYGTVPVARATGGLKDTIEDYNINDKSGTGFLFGDFSASSLEQCLKRALCIFKNKRMWAGLVENCMKKDFSWRPSAQRYASLYKSAIRKARA